MVCLICNHQSRCFKKSNVKRRQSFSYLYNSKTKLTHIWLLEDWTPAWSYKTLTKSCSAWSHINVVSVYSIILWVYCTLKLSKLVGLSIWSSGATVFIIRKVKMDVLECRVDVRVSWRVTICPNWYMWELSFWLTTEAFTSERKTLVHLWVLCFDHTQDSSARGQDFTSVSCPTLLCAFRKHRFMMLLCYYLKLEESHLPLNGHEPDILYSFRTALAWVK